MIEHAARTNGPILLTFVVQASALTAPSYSWPNFAGERAEGFAGPVVSPWGNGAIGQTQGDPRNSVPGAMEVIVELGRDHTPTRSHLSKRPKLARGPPQHSPVAKMPRWQYASKPA